MSIADNPYLLLTPGPLTTSTGVRQSMMMDWCTWDEDYNVGIVQQIRTRLAKMASSESGYTAVLMQGSGTASVEAAIGSIVPEHGKLLVIDNGAYGARAGEIARYLKVRHHIYHCNEMVAPSPDEIDRILSGDPGITHVTMVHCETTTGMLNPLEAVCDIVNKQNRRLIVDAMSSFGGMPIDMSKLGIHYLISSPNKCLQGVPGFGFVIAREDSLVKCKGRARSLSLDLYSQWRCMEDNQGKWRFTSPTHCVRAFYQALLELEDEGGIEARFQRYTSNQKQLVEGMEALGFKCLLARRHHSPFITSFVPPENTDYQFKIFYGMLKDKGFVIYPGKISKANCFRIGNIGEVYPDDIERLLEVVASSMYWKH